MWPFKRKPRHVGPKTVDWQPGDMAECVKHDPWDMNCYGPKLGEKLMVSSVYYNTASYFPVSTFFLNLVGYPDFGYASYEFRKITLTETGADRKVGKRKPVTVQS